MRSFFRKNNFSYLTGTTKPDEIPGHYRMEIQFGKFVSNVVLSGVHVLDEYNLL